MKRILILVAINLFLCSTASTFQGGGGESTKKSTKKTSKTKKERTKLPLAGSNSSTKFLVEGLADPPRGQGFEGRYRVCTPSYFQTIGIRLIQGRLFSDSDKVETPLVLIVNEVLARTYWPNQDAIGKRIRLSGHIDQNPWREVVGVIANVNHDLKVPVTFELFFPAAQDPWGKSDNTTSPGLAAPPAHEEEERRALPKAPMNAANIKANPTPGIVALLLRDFEFDVVTVNSSGSETSRRKGQAQYCTEETAGVSLELVALPGGTFVMGSTEDDREKPPHQVTVGAFYIGKYEVTRAQWRAVARLPKVSGDLDSDPSNFKFKGDNLPVDQVSWEDAMEFCARLSRAAGRTYRLPTEAEWEYACRGGTSTPFAFGQTITPQIVNYNGQYPYAQAPKGTYRETTTPVGFTGVANGFGLFDMHGNVWEWCVDYWHENYNGAPTDGRPWETGDFRRVLRGGSWGNAADDCRSALRGRSTPGNRGNGIGFRVVAVARTP